MANYGITLGYDSDKCSLCKKKKEIRFIYDKDSLLCVAVCDECVKTSGLTVENLINTYGKKSKKKDIEILSREKLYRSCMKPYPSKDKTKEAK